MSRRFFLDRSLGGKKIPGLLRPAGWDVTTMNEHYGRAAGEHIDDVRWITEMASAGFALLTADARTTTNPLERAAIQSVGAVIFIIPTGALTGEQMAQRFLRHEEAIFARAQIPGPAAFVVYEGRLSRVLP